MKMGKRHIVLKIVLVCAIAVLIIAGFFALLISQWRINLSINGESFLKLPYGNSYEETGATALLRGPLLGAGKQLKVTENGEVDSSKLGDFELTYEANFLWLHQLNTRTVRVVDETPPEITLKNDPSHYTLPSMPYEEEGFQASDNYDGDLTDKVTRMETDGKVTYTVTDSSGNRTSVTRRIVYDDPIAPELTLLGEGSMTINAGTTFTDPGCTAQDNCDGDVTEKITCSGKVDIYQAGDYTLTYEVSDSYGNKSSVTRTVTVKAIRQDSTQADNPTGKVIYLTFDDGPSAYTQQLLDILAKYNVKATFFVVNYGHADMIAAEAKAGHTVGVHSSSHEYKEIYSSEDAYFKDFYKMQDIVYTQTGTRPTILRFPGGSSNTVSNFNSGIMTRLTQDVQDMGMQYFDWNVSSGDAGATTDTDVVFQNVIDGVQKQNISVVLQHDSKQYSVNAVERIIVWGLANGYTFLPLKQSSYAAHHHLNN